MTASNVKPDVKMKMEKARHDVIMASLQREEKLWSSQSKKELTDLRSELVSMIAHRKVYKEYSFTKMQEEKMSRYKHGRARTPARVTFEESGGRGSQTARPAADTSHPSYMYGSFTSRSERLKSFHNKEFNDIDHLGSQFNSMDLRGGNDPSTATRFNILLVNPDDYDGEENNIRTRYQVVEAKVFAKPKVRKTISTSRSADPRGEKKKSDIFLEDCRNTFSMRKFVGDKAEKIIRDMSPESRRKREVRRILSKISFPNIVERKKTTSAIFRDYHQLEESKKAREPSSREVRRRDKARLIHTRNATLRLPTMTCSERVDLMGKPESTIQRSKTMV